MIYEFECPCGRIEEVSMLPSEYDDNQACGNCGQKMRRKFTPVNFHISDLPFGYGQGMDADKEMAQADRVMEDRGYK